MMALWKTRTAASICLASGLLIWEAGIAMESQAADRKPPAKPSATVLERRSGSMSAIRTAQRHVLTDAAQFEKLWKESLGPSAKPPVIDFSKSMVVAYFMGEQRSGGYAVQIAKAETRDGKLVIVVHEQSPGPQDFVTGALTQPYAFGVVPRSSLPVKWEITKAPKR